MLDAIVNALITGLCAEGINAAAKYPAAPLEPGESLVCVSLKSAKLTASGCGDYIGIGTVDGLVKDMYGSRAEFCAALDIYSPTPDVGQIKNDTYLSLCDISSVKLTSFTSDDCVFDAKSGMFLCHCEAKATACLVRYTANMRPVYELGEGDA